MGNQNIKPTEPTEPTESIDESSKPKFDTTLMCKIKEEDLLRVRQILKTQKIQEQSSEKIDYSTTELKEDLPQLLTSEHCSSTQIPELKEIKPESPKQTDDEKLDLYMSYHL